MGDFVLKLYRIVLGVLRIYKNKSRKSLSEIQTALKESTV